MSLPTLSPSEFVALANQTLEFAYPIIDVQGEVSGFKVSKHRWVYFDIKDDDSKVKCFGVFQSLPGPVEDGMIVKVSATPRLHPQYGFSLTVQALRFSGQGTIKKAADLLHQKLEKEGLFAEDRKRQIPHPPARIGLVASGESAAYKDFIKVLAARYGGIMIDHIDVAVQGETSVKQVSRAIEEFNKQSELPDVLVVTRGGGSQDDMQAFSSEQVTRAVAASRIPTVVAIGHEVDVSLAELAADLRASTPSNAAELLVPDRHSLAARLKDYSGDLEKLFIQRAESMTDDIKSAQEELEDSVQDSMIRYAQVLDKSFSTLDALSPLATLKRGYSIVKSAGKVVKSSSALKAGDELDIIFIENSVKAKVE